MPTLDTMSATSIVSIDCLFASSFRVRNQSATCKFSRHAPTDLTRHTWRPGRGCSTPRGSDDFPLPPWRKSSLLRLVAKSAGSVMAMASPRLPRLLRHGKQRVASSRPPSRSRSAGRPVGESHHHNALLTSPAPPPADSTFLLPVAGSTVLRSSASRAA